jgi:calcium binding protein 39
MQQADGESPGAEHLLSRPYLLETLLEGYSNPAIALNCGAILRDAARDERVAGLLLASSSLSSSSSDAAAADPTSQQQQQQPSPPLFDRLLSAVDAANFEVASDAFASLRDLLTRHRRVVAARLDSAPDAIFGALSSLTTSTNYVSRRQGVRLLGEILLERANARAMLRYVSDPDNLKAAMVLLKDSSRSIQFEAFHVFKVFVVNPNKLPAIRAILGSNRNKLLAHLADFQVDREDEQFREEKAVVVREISLLGGGSGGLGEGGGGGESGGASARASENEEVQ